MARATLTFNLDDPEDRAEFARAQKAWKYLSALQETANEVFRPARKHGYSDKEIADLMTKLGDDAYTLVGLLEDKFFRILEENNTNLHEE